jgi:hypothetical protein
LPAHIYIVAHFPDLVQPLQLKLPRLTSLMGPSLPTLCIDKHNNYRDHWKGRNINTGNAIPLTSVFNIDLYTTYSHDYLQGQCNHVLLGRARICI